MFDWDWSHMGSTVSICGALHSFSQHDIWKQWAFHSAHLGSAISYSQLVGQKNNIFPLAFLRNSDGVHDSDLAAAYTEPAPY